MQSGHLHPKDVKKKLARELTARFYGEDAAFKAEENFERIFQKHDLPEDIPLVEVTIEEDAVWLPRLLTLAGMVSGTGEGRRMIMQNAVSLDGGKIDDVEYQVKAAGELLLKVGKRKFCKVVFV